MIAVGDEQPGNDSNQDVVNKGKRELKHSQNPANRHTKHNVIIILFIFKIWNPIRHLKNSPRGRKVLKNWLKFNVVSQQQNFGVSKPRCQTFFAWPETRGIPEVKCGRRSFSSCMDKLIGRARMLSMITYKTGVNYKNLN